MRCSVATIERLRTIVLFVILTLGLLAAPLPTEAQQAGKVYRIGYISPGFSSGTPVRTEAFRHGLRELGYIEGQNIVIEYRFAERKVNRLPDLAAELVRLKTQLNDALIEF